MPRKRRDIPWPEQRDNGVWYACWYDGERRRTCRESLETKDAAEAAVRFGRFLTEGSRSSRAVSDAGVTVNQALDWYFNEHVKQNVVAVERQEFALRNLKAYFGLGTLLREVDIPMSRAYVAARMSGAINTNLVRKESKVSASTARREISVVSAAARHALRWKRITVAELPQIELPREEETEEVKWYTKAQIGIIFREADGDLLDFCKITYYTAARRRSIQDITRPQIDLPHSRINLQPPGRRTTKKRRPIVPIFPEIRPIIERRLLAMNGPYLFGEQRDFYDRFTTLTARLGMEGYPHMLRHSRATHMLMDGESIYKVAKLLGDTVKTVEKVYGHACPEFMATTSTIEEAV